MRGDQSRGRGRKDTLKLLTSFGMDGCEGADGVSHWGGRGSIQNWSVFIQNRSAWCEALPASGGFAANDSFGGDLSCPWWTGGCSPSGIVAFCIWCQGLAFQISQVVPLSSSHNSVPFQFTKLRAFAPFPHVLHEILIVAGTLAFTYNVWILHLILSNTYRVFF